jgi:hypothetical protein
VPERRGEAARTSANDSPALALASAEDRPTSATGAVASGLPSPLASPNRPAVIRPLAPARYSLQVTVSLETRDKLREAQDLLRHAVPSGDPALIIDRALTLLVGELRRARQKATKRPPKDRVVRTGGAPCAVPRPEGAAGTARRTASTPSGSGADAPRPSIPRSRHIPATVVRAVWHRDGGQCAFVGTEGRCLERSRLELHHRVPFADGGPATIANLELRCAAHNRYESEIHVARCAGAAGFDDEGRNPPVSSAHRTRSGPS